MKLIKWFAPLMLVFGMLSCGGDSNASFVTEEVDGKFSVDVPDYMTELDLENPDAIFQYGNEIKEHYVMVIMETHEELAEYGLEMDIQTYADLSLEYLKMSISGPEVEEVGNGVEEVNGMETLAYKIRGVFPDNNLDIFYYAIFYRSDKAFYYLTTWTLGEREDRFSDNMEKITHSLKEI